MKGRILDIVKKPVSQAGKAFLKKMMKQEWEARCYAPNERPIEYGFVFNNIAKLNPKTVLDVGTGKSSLPHLMSICGVEVTAIDNIYDYWSKYGMFNRHFYVIDDNIVKTALKTTFDLITCISTLEHIADADMAVKNMAELTNRGGHIIITCPYNERAYAPNVYKLPGSGVAKDMGFICQSFSRDNFNAWCVRYGLEIIEQQYWQCFTGEYWSQGEMIHPHVQVDKDRKHQITCVLLKKQVKS